MRKNEDVSSLVTRPCAWKGEIIHVSMFSSWRLEMLLVFACFFHWVQYKTMLDHKTHYQNDRKSIQIPHKTYFGILIVFTIIFCFFSYSPIPRSSRNTTQKFDSTNYEIPSERIGIVAVITNDTNIQAYEIALSGCWTVISIFIFSQFQRV